MPMQSCRGFAPKHSARQSLHTHSHLLMPMQSCRGHAPKLSASQRATHTLTCRCHCRAAEVMHPSIQQVKGYTHTHLSMLLQSCRGHAPKYSAPKYSASQRATHTLIFRCYCRVAEVMHPNIQPVKGYTHTLLSMSLQSCRGHAPKYSASQRLHTHSLVDVTAELPRSCPQTFSQSKATHTLTF